MTILQDNQVWRNTPMNTPDTQQRNSKRLRKFLLVYPALLLLLVVAIKWASSAFAPTFTYAEMVTISLQSTEEVLTENTYSGWVYLRISGLGRIGADRYSNAFCAYDSGGNVLSADTISPAGYGIAADGMVHLDDFTATYGPRFLPLDDRRCQTEDHIYIIVTTWRNATAHCI
jgi:hypothetical protein